MKNIIKKFLMGVLALTCFNAVAVRKYTPGEAMRRATTGDFDASEKDQILADIPEEWKREHRRIVNEIRSGQRSRQAIEERRKKQMERKKKQGMMKGDIDLSKKDSLFKEEKEELEFISQEPKVEKPQEDLGGKEDVEEEGWSWREELTEEQRNELSQIEKKHKEQKEIEYQKEQLEKIKKIEKEVQKREQEEKNQQNKNTDFDKDFVPEMIKDTSNLSKEQSLCQAMINNIFEFITAQYDKNFDVNKQFSVTYSARNAGLSINNYEGKYKQLITNFNAFMNDFIRVEGNYDVSNFLSQLIEKFENLSTSLSKFDKGCLTSIVNILKEWNNRRLKNLNSKMAQTFEFYLQESLKN